MSNEENNNQSLKVVLFCIGCFTLICGAIVLSEGNKIEGWGTIIMGVLAFYSASKD